MTGPSWLDELALQPGPPWHVMGTRSLATERWLVADDERDAYLARKRGLLERARDVVSVRRPGSTTAAAEAEAAGLVAAAMDARLVGPWAPLEAASLLVQEDLCVVVHRDGQWRLDAGVVCFPSMWSLADNLGLPIAEVHGRVPGYADELAGRVDGFLDRLRVDRPVWRRNWFVHQTPELHLPHPRAAGVSGRVDPPDGLWLRSERQTLRRLPATGAIVFTIRTQQVPLAEVAGRPQVAGALATTIRSWSDDLVDYRGAAAWRAPAVAWLEAIAAR